MCGIYLHHYGLRRFLFAQRRIPGRDGTYTIRFTYDGADYEAPINLRSDTVTNLLGVILMGVIQIRIANIVE